MKIIRVSKLIAGYLIANPPAPNDHITIPAGTLLHWRDILIKQERELRELRERGGIPYNEEAIRKATRNKL